MHENYIVCLKIVVSFVIFISVFIYKCIPPSSKLYQNLLETMFLHWKLVDPWQLSCVCVVRPPTTSHVTPLLLRSGLPIKRGKTIGGTWIVYTSIVKAAFNYDIPVGLLHSFLSLPPFFHSPLGASRLPQKENDYVIMIPEKKWWWCVLLHHFGAHNLIPLAF